jgi:hypothetical protein
MEMCIPDSSSRTQGILRQSELPATAKAPSPPHRVLGLRATYLMGHCPGSLQMLRLIEASETSRSLSSSKAWQGSLKVRSALAFI